MPDDMPAIVTINAQSALPETVVIHDHAIDCAWQNGVSICDCNKELISEQPLFLLRTEPDAAGSDENQRGPRQ